VHKPFGEWLRWRAPIVARVKITEKNTTRERRGNEKNHERMNQDMARKWRLESREWGQVRGNDRYGMNEMKEALSKSMYRGKVPW
jgi:hypothetical protein